MPRPEGRTRSDPAAGEDQACGKSRGRHIPDCPPGQSAHTARAALPTKDEQTTHSDVSTYNDQRGPRTRLGSTRRDPLLGRCLHRPPGIRAGSRRAPARGRRLPCGHRPAAQLARRPARFHQARGPASLLRHLGRIDGLDGEPLHGQPPPAARRRLHTRRQGRIPARLRRDGLCADSQAALSPHSGGHRRHRGFAAAPDALRLLERLAQALGARRVGGPTCSSTAWASGSYSRWRGPCATDTTPSCCARSARWPSSPTRPMSAGSTPTERSACTATKSACATSGPSARTSPSSRRRAT